jgi:hypothetical protein
MGTAGLAVQRGGRVMAGDGQPGLPPFQLEVCSTIWARLQ